jgi:hypothetical protein
MGIGGKLLIALGAVVLAVVLFFIFRPSDGDEAPSAETTTAEDTTTDETTTTPAPPPPAGPQEIRVDIPPGGPIEVQRADVTQDERVVLIVRSAGISDHVHVHGYDLFADVAPGKPARITFRASLPGRFDVELEDRGAPILDLRVTP